MKNLKDQLNSELVDTVIDLYLRIEGLTSKIKYNEALTEILSRLHSPKLEWKSIESAPINKLVSVMYTTTEWPEVAFKDVDNKWYNKKGLIDYIPLYYSDLPIK
jgi:hypothetical protein